MPFAAARLEDCRAVDATPSSQRCLPFRCTLFLDGVTVKECAAAASAKP